MEALVGSNFPGREDLDGPGSRGAGEVGGIIDQNKVGGFEVEVTVFELDFGGGSDATAGGGRLDAK